MTIDWGYIGQSAVVLILVVLLVMWVERVVENFRRRAHRDYGYNYGQDHTLTDSAQWRDSIDAIRARQEAALSNVSSAIEATDDQMVS